jgi:hypothetical protein
VRRQDIQTTMASAKTLRLKLASFNIRYGGPHPTTKKGKKWKIDEERPWVERRDGLVDQVIWEEPDIIGFQEVNVPSIRKCRLFTRCP